MSRLFLTSSFADVAGLFNIWAGENLDKKTITFIPTASKPEKVTFYVKSARKAFEKLGMIVDELDVSVASHQEIAQKLLSNDYIYVSGGNTFYLLQEIKLSGADKLIASQISSGKCYIGESAGSMIAAPNIEYAKEMDDLRKAPGLENFDSLQLIDFYPLPHHKNPPFVKAGERIIANYGQSIKLCPISNHQAIAIDGTTTEILDKPL